jgi:hypothetical protein
MADQITFASGCPVDEERACKILGIAAEFIERGWTIEKDVSSSLRSISEWIRSRKTS